MNNRWNQWVLNYSRGQQFDLLRKLGVNSPSWQDLAYVMAVLLSLAAAWPAPAGRCGTATGRTPGSACSSAWPSGCGAGRGGAAAPRAAHARRARALAVLGERGEALAQLLEALDRARYGAAAHHAAAGRHGQELGRLPRALRRAAPHRRRGGLLAQPRGLAAARRGALGRAAGDRRRHHRRRDLLRPHHRPLPRARRAGHAGFDFPPGRRDRSAFFRERAGGVPGAGAARGLATRPHLRGSFAGAIGLPQFMPGSINRWAVDFDGDGRIDLVRSAGRRHRQRGALPGRTSAGSAACPRTTTVAVPVDTATAPCCWRPTSCPASAPSRFAQRGAVLPETPRERTGRWPWWSCRTAPRAQLRGRHANFYAVTRYN
jgi:hypothetical protein